MHMGAGTGRAAISCRTERGACPRKVPVQKGQTREVLLTETGVQLGSVETRVARMQKYMSPTKHMYQQRPTVKDY